MKNYEKYAEEIKDYKGKDFCEDFVKPYILGTDNCNGIDCTRCGMLQLLWLLEDYEEPEELEFARILTNGEAEKWDKWKDLEEQGRLLELPCAVGDTVYLISSQYSECSKYQERFNDYNCQGCENECDSHKEYFIHVNENMSAEWIVRAMRFNRFGEDVFLTKEAAEAKLAEMEGAE